MSTAAGGWGGIAPALAIPIGIASGLGIGPQWRWRRLSSRPLHDFYSCYKCYRPGTDGSPHEWIRPPGSRHRRDAPDRRWPITGRYTQYGLGLADSRPLCGSVLTRSIFGRRVYAIGNCEPAAYLSGVDTRRVTLACFAISGACAAFFRRSARWLLDPRLSGDGRPVLLLSTWCLAARVSSAAAAHSWHDRWRNPDHATAIDTFSGPCRKLGVRLFMDIIVAMLLLYGRERLHQ